MASVEVPLRISVDTEGIAALVYTTATEMLNGIEQLAAERIAAGEDPATAYRLVISRARGRLEFLKEQDPHQTAALRLKQALT